MRRRTFLAGGAAMGLAGCVTAGTKPMERAEPRGPGADRPNILFVMTDQQRYDCLGANGNPLIQTPHLDGLAARSALFTHAYVQAPVCVPARASFFTGRYAHAHRNRVNYTCLDRRETLMQARLQDAGYRTALVGKTHLYYDYPFDAAAAAATGFDIVDLHDGAGRTDAWSAYVAWRNAHDPLSGVCDYRDVARDVPGAEPGPNPLRAAIAAEYTDTAWTGMQTRARLRELAQRDQPFFLFSSYWKPHSPYEVAAPYDSLYDGVEIPLPRALTSADIDALPLPVQRLIRRDGTPWTMDREELQWVYRSYYGTVSQIDGEVGQTLATLEELGLAENTIVVFCSDHGDQLLAHGLFGKNVFFEESVRVPLMVHVPGHTRPGPVEDLIETIDLMPTLFDFIGLDTPTECHGRSLAPRIAGEDAYTPRDAVFCENIIPEVIGTRFYFEKGVGVYHANEPDNRTRHPDAKMVRTADWKYVYYPEGAEELYDLKNDPGEYDNLAGDPARSAVQRELKDRILDWLATATETDQIAPKWLP